MLRSTVFKITATSPRDQSAKHPVNICSHSIHIATGISAWMISGAFYNIKVTNKMSHFYRSLLCTKCVFIKPCVWNSSFIVNKNEHHLVKSPSVVTQNWFKTLQNTIDILFSNFLLDLNQILKQKCYNRHNIFFSIFCFYTIDTLSGCLFELVKIPFILQTKLSPVKLKPSVYQHIYQVGLTSIKYLILVFQNISWWWLLFWNGPFSFVILAVIYHIYDCNKYQH